MAQRNPIEAFPPQGSKTLGDCCFGYEHCPIFKQKIRLELNFSYPTTGGVLPLKFLRLLCIF